MLSLKNTVSKAWATPFQRHELLLVKFLSSYVFSHAQPAKKLLLPVWTFWMIWLISLSCPFQPFSCPVSFDFPSVQLAKELLLPLAKDEQRKHKLKRLVQVSKIAWTFLFYFLSKNPKTNMTKISITFYRKNSFSTCCPKIQNENENVAKLFTAPKIWKTSKNPKRIGKIHKTFYSTQTPTSWTWNAQDATESPRWVIIDLHI